MYVYHTRDKYLKTIGLFIIPFFFGSIELGDVLHNLQRERDMSALYVSDIAPEEAKNLLIQRYPISDRALMNMSFWPADNKLADTRAEFTTKEKFMNYLNRHRYELDTMNTTVKMELSLYAEVIHVIFNWLVASVTDVGSGSVWKPLTAYLEIIYAIENFGLERAYGAIFFTQGKFDSIDDYLIFMQSQDTGNVTFESARYYSDLVQVK